MKAIAVFKDNLKGFVIFTEKDNEIIIRGKISGLGKKSFHAIHIHEYGDLTDCKSMGPHFNPFKKQHGDINDKNRHIGDLGNIKSNENGEANFRFKDSLLSLKNNKRNILGRGLVIHTGKDDLGKTNHPDSLTTGNAGGRLDCAVIGLMK